MPAKFIDEVPKDLDWVNERAKCVAYKVFTQLRVDVWSGPQN